MDKTLIIGHRGCRNLRAENTLAAMRHAFDLGVDAVEFDIHLTTDGRLVVNHDYLLNPNLTRTKDNQWIGHLQKPIHQHSLKELQQYRLGKIKSFTLYSLMHHAHNSDDESFPTLEDIFALAKSYPHAKLLIEVKTNPVDPKSSSDLEGICKGVVEAIAQSGMKELCMILAFDVRVVKRIRGLDPTLNINLNQMHLKHSNSPYYGGYDLNNFSSIPDFVKKIGANGWSSHHKQLTKDNINLAHTMGLNVYAWTVNSKHRVGKLMEMGVDGIITDRPDKFIPQK